MLKPALRKPKLSDEYVLMTATLMFPDDPEFTGAGAKDLQETMKRHCPKGRKVVAAFWRNGITVVLGYPASQTLPKPEILVNAYHEAYAGRALAEQAKKV